VIADILQHYVNQAAESAQAMKWVWDGERVICLTCRNRALVMNAVQSRLASPGEMRFIKLTGERYTVAHCNRAISAKSSTSKTRGAGSPLHLRADDDGRATVLREGARHPSARGGNDTPPTT
jgi:hypothetical protein